MRKLQTLVLSSILFAIICSFFITLQIQQQQKSPQLVASSSHEPSEYEYQEIRLELITLLTEQNPRIALATLKEKTKANPSITRSCHDFAHELGHAAYEKYDNFGQAMQYQDEMCNSGYLHGIIESHFTTSQDIFTIMQKVCNDYDPAKFIGWQCYHGVGHGLMYYTDNDLPQSLSLCESYLNVSSRMSCINGVFMENFNVDQKVHISQYIKIDNVFYPCTEQKTEYKTDCYLYAPTYYLSIHKNQYHQALSWCKTAEKEFQGSCIVGVGSQAIKENINNPKLVESLCMQGNSQETNACITGMVGLYINHFGRLTEAEELCTKLEKSNQTVCRQVITSQEDLF